jgi:hypothetical protein
MATMFWDCEGLLLREFLCQNQRGQILKTLKSLKTVGSH